MKYLLILIPFLSFAQSDTLVLNQKEYNNVYQGLKLYEWYKQEYPKVVKANNDLLNIVIQQDSTLQGYISRTQQRDIKLDALYQDRVKLAVEQERLKNKGWSIWEWLFFIGGCLGTGWVGYQIGK